MDYKNKYEEVYEEAGHDITHDQAFVDGGLNKREKLEKTISHMNSDWDC